MEITRNKENLLKICRGGQTIWEMLPCEADVNTTKRGDTVVRGYFFPKKGSTITIEIVELDFETYTNKVLYSNSYPSTIGNHFDVNLPFALKQGHAITIEVTNPSCKPTNITRSVN